MKTNLHRLVDGVTINRKGESSKPRRAVFCAAVTLIATLGLTVMASTPASAHEDSCSKIADEDSVGRVFNFHEACHGHDSCYRNKPYGRDSAGRKSCDQQFKNAMNSWCNNRWDDNWKPHHVKNRKLCKKTAETYYQGVRNSSRASRKFYEGYGTYPYAPNTVTAKRYSNSAGEIFWSKSWDPDGIVVKYEIYRDGKLIRVADARSHYESNLRGGTYRYEIVAVDNHGKRSPKIGRVTLKI